MAHGEERGEEEELGGDDDGDALPPRHALLDEELAAVCRAWRVLSRPTAAIRTGCPPLLLMPSLGPPEPLRPGEGIWLQPRRCRLLSPADPASAGSRRRLLSSSALDFCFVGYSFGHIISYQGNHVLLADAVTGHEFRPPDLPTVATFRYGVLTAPLSSPDCSLLLFLGFFVIPRVLFRWRVGKDGWSEHPLDRRTQYITQVTVFKGQILGYDQGGNMFTRILP